MQAIIRAHLRNHFLFYLSQLVAIGVAVYWLRNLPVPGYAIGGLAVLAALMSIHPDIQPGHKVVWMLLIGLFLFIEFRAIDKDRTEFADAEADRRQQENKQFQHIADTLTDSIQQSQNQFATTMDSMKGLWSEATGGNSYLYFEISDVGGPVGELEVPGLMKGAMIANAIPHFVGTYPLHNVYVSTFGPLKWLPGIDYGTVFPGEIGRPRQTITLQFLPDKPRQRFNLWINTSNGSYSQDILWLWASHLYKGRTKKQKLLRVWATPGFPEKDLQADWYKF
jgi:hypothetical protein